MLKAYYYLKKVKSEKLSQTRGAAEDMMTKCNILFWMGSWNRTLNLKNENNMNEVWTLIIIHQHQFTNYEKMYHTDNRENWMRGTWEFSVLCLQFFCNSKTILK